MVDVEEIVFLAIIALILLRSSFRAIKGRRYSRSRVMRLPAVYILLSLFLIFTDFPAKYLYFSVLLLIPAGLIVGNRFGESVSFFMRSGDLYYKRSPVIYFIWLASFVARIALEILLPTNTSAEIIVDAILAFTAGLVLGESMHIIRKSRAFLKNESNSETA